jgi:hypothetical protein
MSPICPLFTVVTTATSALSGEKGLPPNCIRLVVLLPVFKVFGFYIFWEQSRKMFPDKF